MRATQALNDSTDSASEIHVVNADAVTAQPWRNGGGQTRELLAWPDVGRWQVRISRADIADNGPFSSFPQVQRWFAVLEGNGVHLHLPQGVQTLRVGDSPLHFDGAAAPHCELIDGPTRDLNLMARQGHGTVACAQAGEPWSARFALRALYTSVAGAWTDTERTLALSAHTLVWQCADTRSPWAFMPVDNKLPVQAWWMGFSPQSPK